MSETKHALQPEGVPKRHEQGASSGVEQAPACTLVIFGAGGDLTNGC